MIVMTRGCYIRRFINTAMQYYHSFISSKMSLQNPRIVRLIMVLIAAGIFVLAISQALISTSSSHPPLLSRRLNSPSLNYLMPDPHFNRAIDSPASLKETNAADSAAEATISDANANKDSSKDNEQGEVRQRMLKPLLESKATETEDHKQVSSLLVHVMLFAIAGEVLYCLCLYLVLFHVSCDNI